MQNIIEGQVLVLGDNIDTDQIYPGRYLTLFKPEDVGQHCLEGVDPQIPANFIKGGIVVAGRNFGCGSSREHAPIALKAMGAAAIVADSFARIFYRNAINLGLPLITCAGIAQHLKNGEEIKIDVTGGTVTLSDGQVLRADKMNDFMFDILDAGGIKPLIKKRAEAGEFDNR